MMGLVVITHGHFGKELLQTAQDIAGRQDKIGAISVTPDMGLENLSEALRQMLKELSTPEGTLVLVDMLGGTPCNTSLMQAKDQPIEVVTGVNLYMILSAFTHRERMDLKALSQKVSEDGKRAIVLAKDLLMKRLA